MYMRFAPYMRPNADESEVESRKLTLKNRMRICSTPTCTPNAITCLSLHVHLTIVLRNDYPNIDLLYYSYARYIIKNIISRPIYFLVRVVDVDKCINGMLRKGSD